MHLILPNYETHSITKNLYDQYVISLVSMTKHETFVTIIWSLYIMLL